MRFVNRLSFCVLAMSLIALNSSELAADENPKPEKSKADQWMEAKLATSQRVFESLTRGDFQALEENSRRLVVLNFMEQWIRSNSYVDKSDYQGQLNAFEFATKELVRHAQAQDVEGALTAYIKMSQSCVRCHELIRKKH